MSQYNNMTIGKMSYTTKTDKGSYQAIGGSDGKVALAAIGGRATCQASGGRGT